MAQSEKVIISVELRDKGVKAGLDTAALMSGSMFRRRKPDSDSTSFILHIVVNEST